MYVNVKYQTIKQSASDDIQNEVVHFFELEIFLIDQNILFYVQIENQCFIYILRIKKNSF